MARDSTQAPEKMKREREREIKKRLLKKKKKRGEKRKSFLFVCVSESRLEIALGPISYLLCVFSRSRYLARGERRSEARALWFGTV